MLPRAKGGVVSPELKVYGTNNIRVVDVSHLCPVLGIDLTSIVQMSILPLQISAHPQSTMYGM